MLKDPYRVGELLDLGTDEGDGSTLGARSLGSSPSIPSSESVSTSSVIGLRVVRDVVPRAGGDLENRTLGRCNELAATLDGVAEGFRPIVVREAVGDRVPGVVEWNLFDIDAKFGDVEPLAPGSRVPGRDRAVREPDGTIGRGARVRRQASKTV